MSFGRLTTKWRIFRRNLDFSLAKTTIIIQVAAKLHNYVIDNDNIVFSKDSEDIADFGVEVLDDGPDNNRGFIPVLPNRGTNDDTTITRRDWIVEEMTSRDFRRPLHNLIRNQELDEVSVYEADENDHL